MITASSIIRERDLQRERERQRVLEEQQRRAELARLQQIENERRHQLDSMVSLWIHSLNVRRFIDECEKAMSAETPASSAGAQGEWLAWARAYADEINPLTGGSWRKVAQA